MSVIKTLALCFSVCLLFSCDNEVTILDTCEPTVQDSFKYNSAKHDTTTTLNAVEINDVGCMKIQLTYLGGCASSYVELVSQDFSEITFSPNDRNLIVWDVRPAEIDCVQRTDEDVSFDITSLQQYADQWHFRFVDSDLELIHDF